MSEQKIRLRVVTVMTDTDGEKHESKTVHHGTLEEKDGGIELTYEQMLEGVRAKITLIQEADCIQMRRTGEMSGALRFESGKQTKGIYTTIYGEIPVSIYTNQTEVIRTESGGEMKLDYEVFVAGERTGSSRMTLTWRL